MAARLLEEGVLEQDRRIRQQFRKCLEPLLALSTQRSLSALHGVTQPNSFGWLISFLLEHVREADRTESVGAGILLISLVADSDSRAEGLAHFLMSAPQSYTLAVLHGHPNVDHPRRKKPAANWVRTVVLKLLLRDEWTTLSVNDIHMLRRLLLVSNEQRLSVAVQVGLPREHAGLLAAFLSETASVPSKQESFEEYGVVSIESYKHDWSSPSVDFGIFKETLPDEAASAPGILQFIYRVFKFAQTRSVVDLRPLAEFIAEHPNAFLALPGQIRAYAPFDTRRNLVEQVQDIITASDDELSIFVLALQSKAPPVVKLGRTIRLGPKCSLPQWIKLVNDAPDIVWRHWADDLWNKRLVDRPPTFDIPDGVSALVTRLLAHPSLLVRQPLLVGRLLQRTPDRHDEIRVAFLSEAKSRKTEMVHGFGNSSFKLKLPDEAFALPVLLAALVDEDIFRIEPRTAEETQKRMQDICPGFVPYVGDLTMISDNLETPTDVKAAALLLSFLHPDGGANLFRSAAAKLVDAY
jgi:hypothetical protein